MLLEATHKHNAALKEISRLKTEGGLGADPDTDTSVRYGRTVKLDRNLFKWNSLLWAFMVFGNT